MPMTLYAACNVDDALIAKRVPVDQQVQAEIERTFRQQEAAFFDGVDNETPFDGAWTPDDDEVLTIVTPTEARAMTSAIEANALSLPVVDTARFADERIKALFVGELQAGVPRILVQRFTARQLLTRGFSLLQKGEAFHRLTESAFTLDAGLTCVVEGDVLKFKSLTKLRCIIDMMNLYREATDQEVRDFSSHASLVVDDQNLLVAKTNSTSRKLIRAILNNGVLERHSVPDICAAAQKVGLPMQVRDGKILLPPDHKSLKDVLRFLDESRYEGPLSQATYITNSKRRA